MNINVNKVKIVVTSPAENVEEIKLVLGDSGAGIIGNYTHCAISTDCVGTYKGNDESNPYIGIKNQLQTIKEVKIEVQCEISKASLVLQKLREIHPYEEPAIEIIPLLDELDM